jgi:hypothetical protein
MARNLVLIRVKFDPANDVDLDRVNVDFGRRRATISIWRVNRFTGSMVVCSPASKEPDVLAPECFDVPFRKSK